MKDKSYGEKFAFMKMPIVSALGQKLGIGESKLREIIHYIDGGETGTTPAVTSSKNLTPEQVISAVREARYLNSSSIAYTNVALVPAYSDALPLAKKFLKYMTTTEAMQITFEHSGMMPLVQSEIDNLEVENMNLFNKSKVDLVKAANGKMVSMEICSDPLFYMNGLRAYTFTENVIPEKMLGAQSAKDRKSASKIVQEEKDYIAASWTYYCNNAKEELKK
jgi:ABC-type glycerol-3-phosphate transport system substrate-binding protein